MQKKGEVSLGSGINPWSLISPQITIHSASEQFPGYMLLGMYVVFHFPYLSIHNDEEEKLLNFTIVVR